MRTQGDIKRFVLRALARMNGIPMPDAQLLAAINGAMAPRPLLSDVNEAKRELEEAGFIQGRADDLDGTVVTWTLTERGEHKARALG
jgi:DNA-binding MarR family transcriptional regulator